MIDWQTEVPIIMSTSISYGVDPFFIAAIRATENGCSGKEYGVEEYTATYQNQLDVTCATVRNFAANFLSTIFSLISLTSYNHSRLCYSVGFRKGFADKWAPTGVKNDPTNLNVNWFKNNDYFYVKFCKQGKII